jgi:hypothetical protein
MCSKPAKTASAVVENLGRRPSADASTDNVVALLLLLLLLLQGTVHAILWAATASHDVREVLLFQRLCSSSSPSRVRAERPGAAVKLQAFRATRTGSAEAA